MDVLKSVRHLPCWRMLSSCSRGNPNKTATVVRVDICLLSCWLDGQEEGCVSGSVCVCRFKNLLVLPPKWFLYSLLHTAAGITLRGAPGYWGLPECSSPFSVQFYKLHIACPPHTHTFISGHSLSPVGCIELHLAPSSLNQVGSRGGQRMQLASSLLHGSLSFRARCPLPRNLQGQTHHTVKLLSVSSALSLCTPP